jgi:hypothetical protein
MEVPPPHRGALRQLQVVFRQNILYKACFTSLPGEASYSEFVIYCPVIVNVMPVETVYDAPGFTSKLLMVTLVVRTG